jgi:hypothetical protein
MRDAYLTIARFIGAPHLEHPAFKFLSVRKLVFGQSLNRNARMVPQIRPSSSTCFTVLYLLIIWPSNAYINKQAINGLLIFKILSSVPQYTLRQARKFNTHHDDEIRQHETGLCNQSFQ